MNRPIKFRAWWPQSDGIGGTMLNNPRIEFKHLNEIFEEMKDWKFMQFTGLLDKNGKEIYEGDILLDENYEMTSKGVVFDDGSFYTKWRYTDAGDRRKDYFSGGRLCQDACDRYEIIGNIYENPDLLV